VQTPLPLFLTQSQSRKPVAAAPIYNLPSQPGVVGYGDPLNTAVMPNYNHPGALAVPGRSSYADQTMKDISAAGGHVLLYFDCIVWNSFGRYHDLLFNSNAYGSAVPEWPGPVSANGTGNLADFRLGGVMHGGKLETILELMVAENPHMAGWFMDDVGSRSWFPNFDWTTFGSTNQSDYRAGTIQVCQTVRKVADRHKLIFLINGTWTAGTLAANGGGYPSLTTDGNSLADGGVVEHHDGESSFWGPYMDPATSQWAESSPVTNGKPFSFVICTGSSGVTEYRTDGRAAWVSPVQPTPNYDGVAPWGTVADFHPTGLASTPS
jgi:hypothetical protein